MTEESKIETVWVIRCETGCTCCWSENHIRGLYRTYADAHGRVKRWEEGLESSPVGSQYAPRGKYYIEPWSFEKISRNRIVLEDRVFDEKDLPPFIEVNDDGEIPTDTNEVIRYE